MARQRINQKFLVIVAMVILGTGGAALLAQRFFFRESSQKHVEAARRAMREGRLLDARYSFEKALALETRDANLNIEYGDCLQQLSHEDSNFAGQDRKYYEQALAINPASRQAIQRLMSLDIDAVEFYGRPATFTHLHDLAQKMLSLPPDPTADPKAIAQAQAYLHISTLAGWVVGIVQPQEVVDAEIKALVDLQQADPGNPDIPYYLARAYIQEARQLKVQRDPEHEQEANVLFGKAIAVFDTAVTARPKSAALYIRFYLILHEASQLVAESDDAPDKQQYLNKMSDVLFKARSFVTKDDPAFTDVYRLSAEFYLRHDDSAQSEKLLRELVRQRPNDQTARLTIAEMLRFDPSKRAEMINLLKQEITDPGTRGILTQTNKRDLEYTTFLMLDKMSIDQWATVTDPEQKAKIRDEIDLYYRRLVDARPTFPETLKMKAKILLMAGGPDAPINAIPVIEAAIQNFQLLTVSASGTARKDWELQFMLAQCLFDNKQSGAAADELVKICEAVPTHIMAHKLLARLYLEGRKLDQLKDQLDILNKLAANDPLVRNLNLFYLAMIHDVPGVGEIIKKMPEATMPEMKSKIEALYATSRPEQALPLLLKVLEEEEAGEKPPADFYSTVDQAARNLWSAGQKEKAIEVVVAAAKFDPTNKRIDVLVKELKGEPAEVINKARGEAIAAISEPFDRELQYYMFYAGQNQPADALKHLDAAEKIDGDDPRVLDTRFQNAVNEQKWDQAAIYVEKLGLKNADQAHGLIYKYRMCIAQGDLNGAAAVAQDMIKALPQYARSWLCLADVQRFKREYQEAVINYSQSLEKQSSNLDAFRGIIECYYRLNQPQDALRYIREGLRVYPDNPYLGEEQIKYNLAFGNPDEGLASREALRTANPNSRDAWLVAGSAHFQVAQRLQDAGKIDASKEQAAKAKEIFDGGIEKWPDERLFYAYAADLATFRRDSVGGEKALKDLAERPKFAKDVEPRLLLADFYVRAGEVEKAEAAYKAAVDMAVDTPQAPVKTQTRRKLATFYRNQGKFAQALAQLDENSPDQDVQLQRLDILLGAGKPAEGHAILNRLLTAKPKDPQLTATEGLLLMAESKNAEAMKVFDAALEMDPNNQFALFHRGRLFMMQGPDSLDNAVRDLRAARDLMPNAPQVRSILADAMLLRGEPDAAISELIDAVRNQPGSKELRMRLLQLLTHQISPRWGEAEKLLKESIALPEFAHDPDWLLETSRMWRAHREGDKNGDKAMAAIKDALAMAEKDNLPLEQIGVLQQEFLQVLLQSKKYTELLAQCNSLLADPRIAEKVWWVYQLRAIAERNLDQRDKALVDFDKAIKIATDQKNDDIMVALIDSIAETVGVTEAIERLKQRVANGESHWRVILAYLYLKGEDYLNAVQVIDLVLAEPGKLSERERDTAQDIAGLIYIQAREYEKAINVYEQILEHNPNSIGALNNLACIVGDFKENADPKAALKYSSKAVSLLEKKGINTDSNVTDTHGWMLTLDGQYEEGIKYLRIALDRQAVPDCAYHLGYALLHANEPQDAVLELQRAKQLLTERKAKTGRDDPKLAQKIEQSLAKARGMVPAAP